MHERLRGLFLVVGVAAAGPTFTRLHHVVQAHNLQLAIAL